MALPSTCFMLNTIVKLLKKRLKKLFSSLFGKKKASIYIQPLIDAACNKGYVESYSNKADSLHLDIKKKLYEEDLQTSFLKLMGSLAPHFRKGKVRLAVDFQEQGFYEERGFYGKTHSFHMIGTAYKKKPYKKAFKFITISLLTGNKEERIPLYALPWHLGQDLTETIARLIDAVKPWLGKIEVVQFDRGFHSKELVHYLTERKIPYLMHIRKAGNYLKSLVETTKSFYRGTYHMKFTANKTTYRTSSCLYVCKDVKKKDWLFLSSIWFTGKYQLISLYRNRWQIETNYAVHNAARIMSRSTDYMVRYFYYLVDVLLQVLWRISASMMPFKTFLFTLVVGIQKMMERKRGFDET